jgi:WD40 repeat protein
MGWPLSQDYNEAVQSPRSSFSDPELKAGEVVPGPLGLPLPRSGNFADVYQIRGADGRMWALKCFTRPAAKLRDRYLAIDAHLRTAQLPFNVGFEFLPEGVRIRGLWYPALKMEWVEGLQLNTFVRQSLDRPDHLGAVLGLWVRLCKRLREARIAHADLQHGNVLLVPGTTAQRLKLRLIDYDGMWVPALAGNPSDEAGHPNFQHPARLQQRTYTADVDRFPHLVIGCALRALAVAGKPLWDKFDNGDNLLFKEADFRDPANSKLLRALWEIDDPTVTNLVALLVVCSTRPIGDTPWLDEVISGDRTVPVVEAVLNRAADLIGVAHRAARKAAPAAQLFVVPEEANQFTHFGGSRSAERPPRKTSMLPIALAGAAALAAIGVVTAVLVVRGSKPPDDTGTQPPPVAENVSGTTPPARTGLVETKWVNYPSAPRARTVRSLLSGIDVAPPGTKTVRSYPLRGAAALGLSIRPDGSHAVVVSPTQVAVLDLVIGTVKQGAKTTAETVKAAVTPDGRFAVLAGKDHSVRCFDIATGKPIWTKPFPGQVTALEVTPDGERVAASGDKVGYIDWGIADGSEVRRHELLQASLLAFSPDGSHAIAVNDGGVELWSLGDGKSTVVGPGFAATAVCVSADGEQALAAGVGREVKVWAVVDGKELPDRPALLHSGVTALAMAADGTLLFGGTAGDFGYLGPDGTNTMFTSAPDSGAVTGFATTGDGKHALVASANGNVMLTRLADLVRPGGPSPEGPAVGCLDFARSTPIGPEFVHFAAGARGERILAASPTHVRVITTEKFTAGRPLGIPGGGIVAVGFGLDEQILVCQADGDEFLTRTYDPAGGSAGPVFVLPSATGSTDPGKVTRFVPLPERSWVLARTEAAGDVLFDPATGKIIPGWPEPKPNEPVVAVPSPDGKLIAFGTTNSSVKLWTVDTQTADRPLDGSAGVAALAFTPDGTRLIGLWPLGRIRIWDVPTGKPIKEVDHDYPGPFTDLAVISDNLIAIGPADGRLLLNIDTGKALSTGDGPNPLVGRGLVVPARGWVVAADRDDRLTAWKVNSARAGRLPPKPPAPSDWPDVRVYRDAPASPPVGLTFPTDGKTVLVATENGKLLRYTADRLLFAGEEEAAEAPLYGMTLAGERVFTLGRRSLVRVRDAETLEKQFDISSKAPGSAVPILLAAAPDGSAVVLSSDKARLDDVKTKKDIDTAALPRAAVGKKMTQFAFSADGKVSIGRWGDTVTAVWNPKTGMPKVLDELSEAVAASPQSLVLTPDGKIALLGTGDGKLTAWDTSNGEELFKEAVYPDAGAGEAIAAVAMLPNGTDFLTAGRDGRLILWELNGFKKVKEFRVPEGAWRLAVAPDGRAVVMQRAGAVLRIELREPAAGRR